MKSHIMPGVALMVILFSGNIMAATNMTDNVTLNNEGADFDATHNSGSLNSNGFNLGVGYRF
ncbi:hypothetical protein A3219_20690 [Salmonella enterica]|nr:hypothetical protein A3219_20690 [Salmonella enterica]